MECLFIFFLIQFPKHTFDYESKYRLIDFLSFLKRLLVLVTYNIQHEYGTQAKTSNDCVNISLLLVTIFNVGVRILCFFCYRNVL